MPTFRWVLAIPLAVVALTTWTPARASSIRDNAKMFHSEAVQQAESRLERIERSSGIPVVIETIKSIPGLPLKADKDEKERAINKLAEKRDKEIHDEGIYLLISDSDRVISETLTREYLATVLPLAKRHAIRDAFIAGFRNKDFDGGLLNGVKAIETALNGVEVKNRNAHSPVPVAPGARVRGAAGGGSMLGTILLIGGGILAVFLILRVLGGLFGRSAGSGYPNQAGGMGMPRPGMGPGGGGPGYYGGGGYGGRGGGGFFSGLLGGLGGAMAGNWLYDQMSGRHGGSTSAGMGYGPDQSSAAVPDQGDDAIIGADDDGGRGASWDDGNASDTGGGDWGGGDGGGDWGGGGGDWGGGDGGGGGDW
jgi:uncharacterized membrane protein YgcG